MAYTVISQNNTTTTLADELGNVIHVPARVQLATSTSYTITKVNNNTATLEDENGKVLRDVPCVVVLYGGGSGGGGTVDEHNLGWYATSTDLETAHPTGTAGDYAIVAATNTIWVWNETDEQWEDSNVGGLVTSVNSQTGAVVLDADDVLPTQTSQSGKFLTTNGTTASWETVPSCLPTQTGNSGKFLTTDGTDASWATISGALPSQTGNSGKFLTTDGTDASWSALTSVVTISSATATQELATETIYNCTVDMTSLEITLPATPDATFIAQVNFTSGSTPTAFTAPNTMKWLGDDVSSNVFVPAASKRYAIMVYYDGVNMRGISQAVA